jgi:hypothetical protein
MLGGNDNRRSQSVEEQAGAFFEKLDVTSQLGDNRHCSAS